MAEKMLRIFLVVYSAVIDSWADKPVASEKYTWLPTVLHPSGEGFVNEILLNLI